MPKRRTIDYLDKNIRESIHNDVLDIAHYHANKNKGGHFSIPRNVFCYVDYLGYIAFGYIQNGIIKNTDCAVEFIEKYFPGNYKEYAALLYTMWRHGTVHSYEPYSYYDNDISVKPKKVEIRWLSNNNAQEGNRRANINFYPMINKKGKIWLALNNCQLVDDLLFALDKLIDELKTNAKKRKECIRRLNEYGISKSKDTIRSKIRCKVKSQIRLAWENKSKIKINEHGEPAQ